MASGHAVKWPDSLFSPVSTITATIASELGETANGSDHYQALFVLGVLLFAVTFVFNLAADLLVRGRRPR
jgi:phosphate transport system permease protein